MEETETKGTRGRAVGWNVGREDRGRRQEEMGNSSSFFSPKVYQSRTSLSTCAAFLSFSRHCFFIPLFFRRKTFFVSPVEKKVDAKWEKVAGPVFSLFFSLPSEMDSRVWFRLLNLLELDLVIPAERAHFRLSQSLVV